MAAIDDLIAQIEDKALRDRLRKEADRITKEKKFGLVFEEHLPELTAIFGASIRKDSKVALRSGPLSDMWRVLSVREDKAQCRNIASGATKQFLINDLLVVKQFGEPIFPALIPVDRVKNGADNAPWHVLIEADNFHALQLMEYLYAGQVDCIYIDPPYNTGARDWKYNNDYVDINDRWRHSKWLAMMKRRLALAKRLLRRDGVLIVTIDDNEARHLACLLTELFPGYNVFTIVIEHNKRGRQGEEFAKTHEYAYFVVPEVPGAVGEEQLFETIGGETRNLRRTGNNSLREARPNQFYPIWVERKSLKVVDIGESLPLEKKRSDSAKNGLVPIWPVDKDGIERNWHYGRERTIAELNKGKIYAQEQNYGIQIYYTLREKESKRYKTVWSRPTLDASTYGSELLKEILGRPSGFSFPKSLYAERDCLAAVCSHRKNALILDFFAGSGTTLHAVNLLNAIDNGNRRCIMVTNNEVSEAEATALTEKKLRPGSPEWDRQGICESVTWPRSKYSIRGKRDDGTKLDGEYFTGKALSIEKQRRFQHISFISSAQLNNIQKRKALVSLIKAIPQSAVTMEAPFVVSDKYDCSILFDETETDAWLKALDDQFHISDFYIVAEKKVQYESVKKKISDLLGPITMNEQVKTRMDTGFRSNLEYFKLTFLDKNEVALRKQFREILPLLWLRAGAVGPRPDLAKRTSTPDMLIPDMNTFAVLINETKFHDFAKEISKHAAITHVYLVTDSEEAFQEMAAGIKAPNVIQLYRDYLENFVINRGEAVR